MRRGIRGSIVQAPRTGAHGDAVSSALDHLGRGWASRDYVKVIMLVTVIFSIMIWRLREAPHLLDRRANLGSRNNPGFVFPLYRYYQQFPNGSGVVGGRRRGGFHGRGILSDESYPLLQLRGGRRFGDSRDIEGFYIHLKLGNYPTPFKLHFDSGSGLSWIYCSDFDRFGPFMSAFGPNELFRPGVNSYLKCTGATASLCQTLQRPRPEDCHEKHEFDCLFSMSYADGSTYSGRFVNESITLPMHGESDRTFFGSFGCTFKKSGDPENNPTTDGVIGLGDCKGTLLDQLLTSNVISQNVLGVCLAKELPPDSPGNAVGYISLGMDFEEDSNQHSSSVSNWVQLLKDRGKRITVRMPSRRAGLSMYFDTGSDLTYLSTIVYDQVMKALDTYASKRGYVSVEDHEYMDKIYQRLCWEPPSKKRAIGGKFRTSKASLHHDFEPLKFGFEGMASAGKTPPVEYLIIKPENYLMWDVRTRALQLHDVHAALFQLNLLFLGFDATKMHTIISKNQDNGRSNLWVTSFQTDCENYPVKVAGLSSASVEQYAFLHLGYMLGVTCAVVLGVVVGFPKFQEI